MVPVTYQHWEMIENANTFWCSLNELKNCYLLIMSEDESLGLRILLDLVVWESLLEQLHLWAVHGLAYQVTYKPVGQLRETDSLARGKVESCCSVVNHHIEEGIMNVPSQWEATLQCNASHWLCTFTEWSLLKQRQNDDIPKGIFLNENFWTTNNIS